MSVAARNRAALVPMSDEARGRAIRERRVALGIKSVRQFAERTKVARAAVTAAEAGEGTDYTYQRLEAWLDQFEEETGADEPGLREPQRITIRRTSGGDVEVVVAGPIDDPQKLAETVELLLRMTEREQGEE